MFVGPLTASEAAARSVGVLRLLIWAEAIFVRSRRGTHVWSSRAICVEGSKSRPNDPKGSRLIAFALPQP
jgi:hypothetical protein